MRAPRYGWTAILIALLGLASWPLLERFVLRETSTPRAPLESPAFRFIHTRLDKASGVRVYQGYVRPPTWVH